MHEAMRPRQRPVPAPHLIWQQINNKNLSSLPPHLPPHLYWIISRIKYFFISTKLWACLCRILRILTEIFLDVVWETMMGWTVHIYSISRLRYEAQTQNINIITAHYNCEVLAWCINRNNKDKLRNIMSRRSQLNIPMTQPYSLQI